MVFVDEIFKIEKPGARPLSFADGKFLSMCFSFRLTLNLLCNGTLVLFDQWIILEKLLNSRPYKFSSFKGKRIVCSSYVCKMVFQMLIHVLFCLKMRCVCVCVYTCVSQHTSVEVIGLLEFSPYIMWAMGIELRSPSLAADTFMY